MLTGITFDSVNSEEEYKIKLWEEHTIVERTKLKVRRKTEKHLSAYRTIDYII